MILVGNQRAGGQQLAQHLMNDADNDHVTVHEIRGFVSDSLDGAIKEAYAISRGTRCHQFLYSVSLNPPETATVPVESFEKAIDEIEGKLGLKDQPRAIVFHEKNGRRHAHCVWSRIDANSMTARNISHSKLKLMDISRQLFLEHGWKMPSGLQNRHQASPLNYDLAEWQHAKRIWRDPKRIKAVFRQCLEASDGLKAFQSAMECSGFYLARGNQRGFVALDINGEVFSVSRWSGTKTRGLSEKLGKADQLPTVDEVANSLAHQVDAKLRALAEQAQRDHEEALVQIRDKVKALVTQQRRERNELRRNQKQRWQQEAAARASRFRKGLRGIWDRLTGVRRKTIERNQAEVDVCNLRDRKERGELIAKQLASRRPLRVQAQHMSCQYEDRLAALRTEQQFHREQLQLAGAQYEPEPDFSF